MVQLLKVQLLIGLFHFNIGFSYLKVVYQSNNQAIKQSSHQTIKPSNSSTLQHLRFLMQHRNQFLRIIFIY